MSRFSTTLQDAGVEVKMITGDHLNIAIETARMVGMATNILPGEDGFGACCKCAGKVRQQCWANASSFSPASQPASQPASLPACLPACLSAHRPTKPTKAPKFYLERFERVACCQCGDW